MRKLDRNIADAPTILTDEKLAGPIEKKDAIKFFKRKKIPKGETFTYKAYSDESVKTALAKISHDKCAYCEVKVLESQDGDIEHFRPKGEVNNNDGKPIKPGYYWLGSTWENLHLSCIHCNQSRKQPTQSGTKVTMGKKNQFPLIKGSIRIRTHTKDIADEEPNRLLLDPCNDIPEEHLRFDKDGIIYPRLVAGEKSPKGQASIDVFALLRNNLIKARKEHALMVETALSFMESTISRYNEAIINKLTALELELLKTEMDEAIRKLKVYTDPDKRFSLLSLCIVQEHLAKYRITYGGNG